MAGLRLFPRHAARLARERSGIAITEFALCLPLFVGVSLVGTEMVNYAYAWQKVGDMATITADNISRNRFGFTTISEADVTETLEGVKATGSNLPFGTNGRMIVSSVQPVTDGSGNLTDEKIRWQRCTGALRVASSYGAEGASLGTAGIGPTGRKIAAAAGSELIFVEVVYSYQPLISPALLGTRTIRAIAGVSVRDRAANDLQSTGTASSCSTYTA